MSPDRGDAPSCPMVGLAHFLLCPPSSIRHLPGEPGLFPSSLYTVLCSSGHSVFLSGDLHPGGLLSEAQALSSKSGCVLLLGIWELWREMVSTTHSLPRPLLLLCFQLPQLEHG